ncbi:DUF3300 domain-containing protein [Paraburkholderia hayleyella]|uniref:DUF3300 domain-containing protein n=1 Tax=Paraburkholderia hayleyella TaxID=2152889 RepID=UPI0012924B16|nr:DUF3300 domain-containing protein [Paraburkholderia hayleyella]
MQRSEAYKRRLLLLCAALAGAPLFIGTAAPTAAWAQNTAKTSAKISNPQLDALSAPIALYPDALLAQVLMASTFASDVAAAAAWSKAHPNLTGDDAVKAVASEPWDPSVQSLVAFPQVLAMMASKPSWVSQLGDAFLAQPNDVMDSVQRLRRQAQQAGNLKSGEQQKVIVEQSTIQIVPVNPQVVYVPTYNPTVVYGTWPYPAYPPVYVPPPPGYAIAAGFATGLAFGAGVAVANSLWGGFNWNTHDVNINVNRYNNLNVNNRINANGNTANWNRNDSVNRHANLNRGPDGMAGGMGMAQRDAYRGRDITAARTQAQQTLQNRTGQSLGGNASQRVQEIHQGGAATGEGNLRSQAHSLNHDNALRGAGNGNAARQEMQRGEASRQALSGRMPSATRGSMAEPAGLQAPRPNGLGANGGGILRGGGGGGMQRGGGQRHFHR